MDKENRDIELMVECFSEKEDVSLGCSFYISEEENEKKRLLDPRDLAIGLSESYYELCDEFTPGIKKARKMLSEGKGVHLQEALLEVFGPFGLKFTVNGMEEAFDYDLDVDECLFELMAISTVIDERE